jgi:hypothetical protein
MVTARKDVSIDLQEVHHLFENAKEFAVLVQHDCVAETKA